MYNPNYPSVMATESTGDWFKPGAKAQMAVKMVNVPHKYSVFVQSFYAKHMFRVNLEYMYLGNKHVLTLDVDDEEVLGSSEVHMKMKCMHALSKMVCDALPDSGFEVMSSVRKGIGEAMGLYSSPDKPVKTAAYKPGGFVKRAPHEVKGSSAQVASQALPGVDHKVTMPCECYKELPHTRLLLWSAVQHLNDGHPEWTREKIADWLDELHDKGEVDLTFPVMEEEPVEPNSCDEVQVPVAKGKVFVLHETTIEPHPSYKPYKAVGKPLAGPYYDMTDEQKEQYNESFHKLLNHLKDSPDSMVSLKGSAEQMKEAMNTLAGKLPGEWENVGFTTTEGIDSNDNSNDQE